MVAEPFGEAGLTVATVVEQGWSGLADKELWSRVVAEGFFLVTPTRDSVTFACTRPATIPESFFFGPTERASLNSVPS